MNKLDQLIAWLKQSRGDNPAQLTIDELIDILSELRDLNRRVEQLEFDRRTRTWGLDPHRDRARSP